MDLTEYIGNLRGLLKMDAPRFGLVIDRQVQCRVLPQLSGTRAELEPQLWALLVLCLEGPEAPVPALDEPLWEKACAAATSGKQLSTTSGARFPRAAAAVLQSMAELREVGVLPRPKI